MAKRGSVGYKRNTRHRDQLDCKVSDDSDEDYMVGEDEEIGESEEEYCSSFVEDESEESLGKFEEEEDDEWVEKKVKLPQKPRVRKGSQGKKKNGVVKRRRKTVVVHSDDEEDDDGDDSDDNFASTKGRKKRRVSYKEEEEEEEEDEEEGIEVAYREADSDQRPGKKTTVSYKEDDDYRDDETARKKAKFSNGEEKDDVHYSNDGDDDGDDNDDDEDEEFLPDEIDDDEEEFPIAMNNNMGWVSIEKRCIVKGRRKSRNAGVMKVAKRNKIKKKQGSTRKVRSRHGKVLRDDYQVVQTKKISERGRSRKKSTSNSDSDFESSGSSDHEYTISEEEREQIREANEFCRKNLQMTQETLVLPPQRKRANRKGKGKVEGIKVEIGKQICGICLSEEGKRTIRGTLNCCSHYFCFACIMEWSKVESRCPLCKQRFATISRTACSFAGLGLRTQVITVPERDQVYQPSEEERRGFLDPYENMLCIECQQGGDDALMLLCDLCDSPAHTYCVGLGHEVPEGNWYCDGCRPTVLASSGDHGASNNLSVGSSPVASVRETFDLNELYIPDTPLSQGPEHSMSPRHSVGNFQAASPASGTGAATVLERRRIHRQIYQFIHSRSRSERMDGATTVSENSVFGTQVGGGREFVPGYTAPQNIYFQESLQDNATIPLQPREVLSPRFSRFRGQAISNLASTSGDHSFGRMSHSEFSGSNVRVGLQQGPQQLHLCSGSSDISTDVGFPNQFREARVPSRTLQESVRTRF